MLQRGAEGVEWMALYTSSDPFRVLSVTERALLCTTHKHDETFFGGKCLTIVKRSLTPCVSTDFFYFSRTELSALARHNDVAVYGIGRELPFTMAAWSEKMTLNFPLLSDATLSVAQVCMSLKLKRLLYYTAPRGQIDLLAGRGDRQYSVKDTR